MPVSQEEVRALLDDNTYRRFSLLIGSAARALYYVALVNLQEALEWERDDLVIQAAQRWGRAEEQAMELRYEAEWAKWAVLVRFQQQQSSKTHS